MGERITKNSQKQQARSDSPTGSDCQNLPSEHPLAAQLLALATQAEEAGLPETAACLRRLVEDFRGEGFSAKLRAARARAGISQKEAAERAGLSFNTYRNAEIGQAPTAKTLAAIQSVPELRVSGEHEEPQWWHSNKFNPVDLYRRLRNTLEHDEGFLEPGHLYLDPAGAESYSSITSEQRYEVQREPAPIEDAALTISAHLGRRYDAVLLGSGDGSVESRFLRLLPPAGAIIPVDISQALLSAAYSRLVVDFPQSRVFALQGDITHLREHRQLANRGSQVDVLVTMFGKTFANLPNESSFLDGLGVFLEGTVFILDLNLARGTTEAEIRKSDEALIRGVPPSYGTFLKGPLARYLPGFKDAELKYELAMLPLKGSYSLDCWADVTLFDGSRRRFRVAQFKRYNLSNLIALFESYGWKHLATHGYRGMEDKASLVAFVRSP